MHCGAEGLFRELAAVDCTASRLATDAEVLAAVTGKPPGEVCETCKGPATQWDYDQLKFFCASHVEQPVFTVPLDTDRLRRAAEGKK